MKQQIFSLKELCRIADVTPRTVRFYITQGLLPPPDGPKSHSQYTQEHLLRLHISRGLKARFWPLREIKKVMAGKSVAELQSLVQYLGEAEQKEQNQMNLEQTIPSPLIVLERFTPNEKTIPVARVEANGPGFLPKRTPLPQVGLNPPPIFYETPPVEAASNIWERITIAPGIELNLKSSIANQHRETLEALAQEIRRKLS